MVSDDLYTFSLTIAPKETDPPVVETNKSLYDLRNTINPQLRGVCTNGLGKKGVS
jgi:hypothetical protein